MKNWTMFSLGLIICFGCGKKPDDEAVAKKSIPKDSFTFWNPDAEMSASAHMKDPQTIVIDSLPSKLSAKLTYMAIVPEFVAKAQPTIKDWCKSQADLAKVNLQGVSVDAMEESAGLFQLMGVEWSEAVMNSAKTAAIRAGFKTALSVDPMLAQQFSGAIVKGPLAALTKMSQEDDQTMANLFTRGMQETLKVGFVCDLLNGGTKLSLSFKEANKKVAIVVTDVEKRIIP